MTRRSERVADRVREVLAAVIRGEVRDPRVGFVTVTDVQLSPDLRYARVYVSFLETSPGVESPETPLPAGAVDDRDEALAALRHAAPFLRRRLAREAGLRRTPELRFAVDPSIAGGFRIDEILDDVAPPAEPASDAPGDASDGPADPPGPRDGDPE